ncbi:MAG TPA: hypothetical protein VEO54_15390 [Thermoanaerobaculia bacterium]|nr:hypothetical protein [Thermoanaerobaculia bacterium]
MASSVVCANCGSVDKTKSFTPGSILLEIVAWCLLLIPGILYSFWRLSARRKVCAVCGSPNLVPAESPVGRRLMAEKPASGTEAMTHG